jgi:hypothetical protein
LRSRGCSYGGVSSHYPMGLFLPCRSRGVPSVVKSFGLMGETPSEQSYEGGSKGRHKGIRGNTAEGYYDQSALYKPQIGGVAHCP